jgi:hypothetical protein
MTDDLVKRLRRDLASGLSASIGDTEEAAARIEELEEALDALLREAEDLYDIVAEDNGLDRNRIPTAIISARKALKEGNR